MKLKKTAIAALLSLTAIGFGATAAPHDHAAMGHGQPAQTEAPAPSSDAQPMPGGHGMHGQQGGMMCGGKGMMGSHQGMMANLTPEQQALLKKAHDDFRAAAPKAHLQGLRIQSRADRRPAGRTEAAGGK